MAAPTGGYRILMKRYTITRILSFKDAEHITTFSSNPKEHI